MNEPEELFDSFQKASKTLYMLAYRKRLKYLWITIGIESGLWILLAIFIPSLSWLISGGWVVTVIVLIYNIWLYRKKLQEFSHAKPYMKEAFTDKLDQVQ